MVVLDQVDPVGEAQADGQLDLVLRLVLPVAAPALRLDEVGLGQGIGPRREEGLQILLGRPIAPERMKKWMTQIGIGAAPLENSLVNA